MPLVTANQFQLAPDVSGLANRISQIVDSRKVEQKEILRQNLKTTGAHFLRIRDLPDIHAKKKEIADLATAAFKRGEDIEVYDNAMLIQDPDELNNYLMRIATRAGTADEKISLEMFKQGLFPEEKEKFKTIYDDKGNIVGQESTTTNKVIADPRTRDPEGFQTDFGKLIADGELVKNTFGEDSSQYKAFQEMLKAEEDGEPPSMSDVAGIRKEFTKQSGDFIKMRDAFKKIQSASPTAVGDMSLIYGFMTIVDPGSSVKEGEYATAQNAQGIPEQIRTLYNRAIDGDTLGDKTRGQFKLEAGKLFQAQLGSQKHLESVFRGLAARQKLAPENVAIDFIGDLRDFAPAERKLIDYSRDELESMARTPEGRDKLRALRKQETQ